MRYSKAKLLPLVLTAALIVLDQIVKWIVTRTLPYGRPVEVIGEFLRFTYVRNPVIAFSIGRNLGGSAPIILARVLPLVVMALLLAYFIVGKDISRSQRWILAGVLGGGLGNYVDRLFRGWEVVDFIDFKFYGLFGLERWPTFNVADLTIVVSGLLLLASFLWSGRKKQA